LPDSPAPAPLWQRRPLTLGERALELERFEKAMRSQKKSLYLRFGFEYVVWFFVGLSLMYWSFRTTDSPYAGLFFFGGIGLGDAGMLLTLIRARKEAERCGLL
jgi:L-asparagine transporter-like permease